ncbi:MAG TPA: PPC domain-containing DNA-binding protein [Amaricoccus sp.]|nr:PPC domain-containing DNA-binding protein [Amaricoccus sp.]
MRTKLLDDNDRLRTHAVILETGDEVMASLDRFARDERVTAARVSAIGAFRRAVLAYFDWEAKEYAAIPVEEQVEVASLDGDIALDETGAPALHLHAVLGRRDGSALAGHLQSGEVRPTLELLVTDTPSHLRRVADAASGLALIKV